MRGWHIPLHLKHILETSMLICILVLRAPNGRTINIERTPKQGTLVSQYDISLKYFFLWHLTYNIISYIRNTPEIKWVVDNVQHIHIYNIYIFALVKEKMAHLSNVRTKKNVHHQGAQSKLLYAIYENCAQSPTWRTLELSLIISHFGAINCMRYVLAYSLSSFKFSWKMVRSSLVLIGRYNGKSITKSRNCDQIIYVI